MFIRIQTHTNVKSETLKNKGLTVVNRQIEGKKLMCMTFLSKKKKEIN